MPVEHSGDDENIDALESLSRDSADARRPAQARSARRSHAAAPRTSQPEPPPPELDLAPPSPPSKPQPARLAQGEMPRYRCLSCGYPLLGGQNNRCPECGRSFSKSDLRLWFSGEEETRLNNVIWFVVACLFLKLMLIPVLVHAARLATMIIIAWACVRAAYGKGDSAGGYFGMAGLIAAGLMLLTAWQETPLGFYALDMIAGCLLLLAMVHDAQGGTLARASGSRTAALVLLFLSPLVASACWYAHDQGVQPWSTTVVPDPYGDVFGFVIPYAGAAGVWLLVWWTLTRMRKLLFGRLSGDEAT